MKKILAALFALMLCGQARAQQSPLIFKTVSAGTITYGAGVVTINGVDTAYSAGSLSGFTASANDCSFAHIVAGTAACDYIFEPAGGGALQTSSVFSTAYPYIVGIVTTDGSQNVVTYQAWTPPPPFAFLVNTPVAVTPSATPTFNASAGSILYLNLNQNVTSSTATAPPAGIGWIDISVTQPNSGGPYTFTWPANFHWPAGTAAQGLSTSGGQALIISTAANTSSGARCFYFGSFGWYCPYTFLGMH